MNTASLILQVRDTLDELALDIHTLVETDPDRREPGARKRVSVSLSKLEQALFAAEADNARRKRAAPEAMHFGFGEVESHLGGAREEVEKVRAEFEQLRFRPTDRRAAICQAMMMCGMWLWQARLEAAANTVDASGRRAA